MFCFSTTSDQCNCGGSAPATRPADALWISDGCGHAVLLLRAESPPLVPAGACDSNSGDGRLRLHAGRMAAGTCRNRLGSRDFSPMAGRQDSGCTSHETKTAPDQCAAGPDENRVTIQPAFWPHVFEPRHAISPALLLENARGPLKGNHDKYNKSIPGAANK